MQNTFPRKCMILVSVLLLAASIAYIGYGLIVPSTCDGYYRWQESAYVLRGTDPYLVASGAAGPIPEIGALKPDGGNMPWTYLMSNIIYPGFLPYRAALIWARTLFVLLLAVTAIRVWKYISRAYPTSTPYSLAMTSVFFASYMWFATLRLGNHAAYVTLLLILLLTFDHDRYWLPAGLLYAYVLIKPQDSALFLLYFLLRKRWKPILTAGGILLAVTLATACIIRCSPVRMLLNAWDLCVSYENLDNYIYYGLLDPLVSVFHVPSAVVLPAGMLLSIAAAGYLSLRCRRISEETAFAALSVLSVSWMYSQPSDMILLGFVGFACMSFLFFGASEKRFRWALLCGAFLGAVPIIGRIYMVGPAAPLLVRLLYFVIVIALISGQESDRIRIA